jgi:hypothetical protein
MALTFESVWEGAKGTQERMQLLYDDIKAHTLKRILYRGCT